MKHTKKCKECGKVKETKNFYKNRNICKKCYNVKIRKKRYDDIYGISLDEYDVMFEERKGLCDICNQPQKNKRLAVDHCHYTGKVRGLLCNKCNNGIGLLGDTYECIKKALNYLKGK